MIERLNETSVAVYHHPPGAQMSGGKEAKSHAYDVALSFAGEDRQYVEEVAASLREKGIRVFYDRYEEANLWGKNLYVHLSRVYEREARFTVMFISRHYSQKLWTNHERQSAQARAFAEHQEYILPARFDDAEIPGVLQTVGYVDLRRKSPIQLSDLIGEKLRSASGSVDSKRSKGSSTLDGRETKAGLSTRSVGSQQRLEADRPPRAASPIDSVRVSTSRPRASRVAGSQQSLSNPFQKAGALPADALSYVERRCDSQMRVALASNRLIVIHGVFGVGKSSLLVRTQRLVDTGRTVCFLDLQGTRTDEPTLFHDRFFECVGRELGSMRDWTDLASAVTKQPAAILLDELGHLTPVVAARFIPSLCHLALSVDIRIVVCLPKPIRSLLTEAGLQNPKYHRDWREVEVELLDDRGVDALLTLLPSRARRIAGEHRARIIHHACGLPHRVQDLCFDLCAGVRKGMTTQALEAIVQQRTAKT